MKKTLALLIGISLFSVSAFSEEDSFAQKSAQLQTNQVKARGQAAAAGSDSSVSLSMVVWGVGLAVGIGLLAGLLNSSAGVTHAHSAN